MMVRGREILRAAAVTILAVPALVAQVTLNGRVVDDNGAAVGGARVELRGSAQAAPAVATSTDQGTFRLSLAQPGDYFLQAERSGFFLLNNAKVTLNDGPNRITVTLNHLREVVEKIDVAYSPPAVDLAQTSEQEQLNNVQILEVPYPASQDYRNSLPMFPGVVQDTQGSLHFNGGTSDQTSYSLDGFDISDIYDGTLEAQVSIDAVRSLDLETSRFSAAKGRGSAGALDIVSGMGDDRWRFGIANFVPSVTFQRGVTLSKWTPRLTFSGPIAKGRAWFYNGFGAFYDVNTVQELPPGQDRGRTLTASNLSRFQVNPTPSNILTGSLLVNFEDTDHQGLSFLNPVEATLNLRRRMYIGTVKDQIYLPSRTLIEIGLAVTRGYSQDAPQGTKTFVLSPSGRSGNYFSGLTRHTRREQWMADVILPPASAWGTHEFKLGADLLHSSFDQDNIRHDYQVLREDGTLARSVQFQGNGLIGKTDFEAALYAQDRWRPRQGVVVELGLRGEWNQIVRDMLLSPRLSAAWAPSWMKGAKVSAGFGVFNDALNLAILAQHQDQVSLSTFYSRSGAATGFPLETIFLTNEQSLRMPRSRIYSVSLEKNLPREFYGKASYTRRGGWDGFTFAGPGAIGSAPLVAYTLRNQRNDRYDAVEIGVRRLFGGQYEWSASYVYSRVRTNAVVDYTLENPVFGPQGGGPLDWDVPHRFLTWGWAPVPSGFGPPKLRFLLRQVTAAYLVEARSGFPFGVVNEEGLMVGKPNDRRFPYYFNVNIHFEKKFRLLNCVWAWRFGLNNLTNHGNPNVVNNNIDSPFFLTYGRGQRRAFNVRLRFLGRR